MVRGGVGESWQLSQLSSGSILTILLLPKDNMEMGQNPGTPGEPQVIAGIYGCE